MPMFTKGNWQVEFPNSRECEVFCGEIKIASLEPEYGYGLEGGRNEFYANGNLISYAPEMYYMLKSIVENKKASIKEIKALLNSIDNF